MQALAYNGTCMVIEEKSILVSRPKSIKEWKFFNLNFYGDHNYFSELESCQ